MQHLHVKNVSVCHIIFVKSRNFFTTICCLLYQVGWPSNFTNHSACILNEVNLFLVYELFQAESRLSSLKTEIEEHALRCKTEAEKVQQEFTRRETQLSILEKEADQFVKVYIYIYIFGFPIFHTLLVTYYLLRYSA